jgi:hypothetical protein
MSVLKKIFVGSAIGAGLYAIGSYFKKFKRTTANLESYAKVKVHKVNFSGLTLSIDVQLKNPSSMGFKFKYPFIKMIYPANSTSVIGSSHVIDRDITLPAYGEAVADKIMIEIPARNLLSASAGLISSLIGGEAIRIKVVTITTIDLGWKKMPYEKTETLSL